MNVGVYIKDEDYQKIKESALLDMRSANSLIVKGALRLADEIKRGK